MSNKLISLTFVDVQSFDGLLYPEDLDKIKEIRCTIVGWLIKEDKKNFYIAKEVWENGAFKYLHIVPKDYVVFGLEYGDGRSCKYCAKKRVFIEKKE